MCTGIASSHRRVLLLLALTVMTGCNKALGQPPNTARGQSVEHPAQLLKKYKEDERNAVRIRTDSARGRIWMLGINNDVRVYDDSSKRLLRQFTLPGWLAFKMTRCTPDLILDGLGSAFISSNVKPWIWRIDAASFQMRVHEMSMPGREGFDFGFGALAFSSKGNLYGLSPSGDSLWSIDLVRANARLIESYQPPLEECTLSAQSVDRFGTTR